MRPKVFIFVTKGVSRRVLLIFFAQKYGRGKECCWVYGEDGTDILKFALASNASSLILVHNHPSGYPTHSREDRTLTGRIEEACKLIGLKLNDHIIIGGDGYGYS
ncbi:MAG: JAB domain-containing protein [Lachnospiraceae bacterium]|nr:JAB domain-containing protein [Lachnospiraceae bacterium]